MNVDRNAQMQKFEKFTSKTRLFLIKMNHHSLQQKNLYCKYVSVSTNL